MPSFDVGILLANRWLVAGSTSNAASGETIYGKMKRLARVARTSNPRVLPVLIGATAWATGIVYAAGAQVSNAGNVYKTATGGTSGTTAPTHTSGSASDGGVTWIYIGPQTAPVVSGSTTAPSGLTQIFTWAARPDLFQMQGGTALTGTNSVAGYLNSWSVTQFGTGSGTVGSNPALNSTTWRVPFMIDTVKCAFTVFNGTAQVRFLVDGQYVDLNTVTPPGTGGTNYYITLDFTNCGGRALHRIEFEADKNPWLLDFRISPTESVYPAPLTDELRMIVIGDSITGATGTNISGDGWVHIMGDYLGIRDRWNSGSGGTGWLATSGGTKYNMRQRITDLTTKSPDIGVMAMGVNDAALAGGPSQNDVTGEINATYALVRSALPNMPLFILGSFLQVTNLVNVRQTEAQISAAVNALIAAGDQNLFFVPITGTGAATDKPWLTGTGTTSTPTGNGNADLYMGGTTGTDVTHPNTAGHYQYGRRAADGILVAIAAKQ